MRLEPGETEVPLAGKPMLTPCAKQVVVKAASIAAIVNFMVLWWRLEKAKSLLALYKKTFG